MKKYFLLVTVLVNLFLFADVNENWDYENPFKFSHQLTTQEALLYETYNRDFQETDPPIGPVRPIAEWEPMKAVMVRYPLGISASLVAQFTEYIPVICIVTSGQQNSANNAFQNAGANMSQISYMNYPTETYWCRDYGPWFIAYGDEEIGVCNFKYNRPRPNDDDIPMFYAEDNGLEWFGMNLEQTGGNYMCDGVSQAVCTDLVVEENPNLSIDEINEKMEDYLGITNFHISPDPLGDYIKHVDCWGKYLDVDKILIARVPTTNSQYDEYEAVAEYFSNVISSYGTPLQVFRCDVPGNYQVTPFTNSLILNGKVFIPVTGTSYDAAAIEVYETAMPGYEIITVNGGSENWLNTDALHCRTHEIADDEMLYISHNPINAYPANEDLVISADFVAYSDTELVADQLTVFYKIDSGNFVEETMTHVSNNTYQVTLPAQPALTQISYYIHGEDQVGKNANHPYIGSYDPHIFQIGTAQINVAVEQIDIQANPGEQSDTNFQIGNSGELDLFYNIDYTASAGTREDYEYNIPNSPAAYSYDYNTYTEVGWTDYEIEQTGVISSVTISFDWTTDSYPSEGSFRLESPTGTQRVICAGITSGNYSYEINNFYSENMNGNWKIWIEDSYGDGGHVASNIVMTISTLSPEETWLTVNPVNGVVAPGESATISVTADATELEEGNYVGNVHITSNDYENDEQNISVNFEVSGVFCINDDIISVSGILGNYPNPFNPSTSIVFAMNKAAHVSLEIYNIRGQKVKTLVNEFKDAGSHQITWNGLDDEHNQVSSGIYFTKMKTDSTSSIKKMILMK